MKKLILITILSVLFQGCIRGNTSTEDLMETVEGNSALQYSGNFTKGPYGSNVNGKAEIYEKN